MNTRGFPDEGSVPRICRQTRSHLSGEIADGALGDISLGEDEYVALVEHLQSCAHCLEIVEAVQSDWASEVDEPLRRANSPSYVPAQESKSRQITRRFRRTAGITIAATVATALLVLQLVRPPASVSETASIKGGLNSDQRTETQLEAESLLPEQVRESDATPMPSQAPEPVIALRAQPGFSVAQRDESNEIPFYWVLPTGSRAEHN